MDNTQAVEVIKLNWPDARYSMLREALELSIKLLEAEELAQLSHNRPIMPVCPHCGTRAVTIIRDSRAFLF
jgi:hypothetical protein